MNNLFNNLPTIILGIIILIIIIKILNLIANKYIINHRDELYSYNKPLSHECRELGKKIISDLPIYFNNATEMGLNQVYHCSRSIVSNAMNDNVKYLLKYSNIEYDLYFLEKLDFCTNFLQNLTDLKNGLEEIKTKTENKLPFLITLFSTRKKIPFNICDVSYEINKINTPTFIFYYTSPAGKTTTKHEVNINIDIMKSLMLEVESKVNKKGHTRLQRNSMSNDLREAIKKRDNYTCCICGNSVYKEPNLLLEVDHIVPISKGGKTESNNLQTLCWRCNRAKSCK